MSRQIVLDTDVFSYLFKGSPNAKPYMELIRETEPVLSFMTLAELECWALRRDWGSERRAGLERFLAKFPIYESDRHLCERWARITELRFRAGEPISCADAWIAATALELDCPLVTHNARDYRGIPALELRTAME